MSTKPTRRRFLQAGVAAGLALGASAIAVVRSRGYELPAGRSLRAFHAWQFIVLQHAARRIVAPDRPGDATIPSADDLDVAGFVDGWVARMAPKVQRDLGRFMAFIEHVAPLGVGFVSRFTHLSPDDQDSVLASIEASPVDLLRAGFDGLRSLVFMGYYRDARTWGIVGYDGPLIGRPPGGWR